MSTPSWPRLVGWMATAAPGPVRGRWRKLEEGQERHGTFACRPDGQEIAFDQSGELTTHFHPRHLLQGEFDRSDDDFHRLVGPVTAAHHDGRPCWQVQLEPPARKSGLLTIVVDEATGLRVRQSNQEHGRWEEVTDLQLDAELPDELFAPLRRGVAQRENRDALYALVQRRPPPTPAWFPWRESDGWAPDCVEVRTPGGKGSVGRARAGAAAPVRSWFRHSPVHRFEAEGWAWAVASDPPMSLADARQVVANIEDSS